MSIPLSVYICYQSLCTSRWEGFRSNHLARFLLHTGLPSRTQNLEISGQKRTLVKHLAIEATVKERILKANGGKKEKKRNSKVSYNVFGKILNKLFRISLQRAVQGYGQNAAYPVISKQIYSVELAAMASIGACG